MVGITDTYTHLANLDTGNIREFLIYAKTIPEVVLDCVEGCGICIQSGGSDIDSHENNRVSMVSCSKHRILSVPHIHNEYIVL